MIDSLPPAARIAVRARTEIAGLVFGLGILTAVGMLNAMPLGQDRFLTQMGLTLGLATLAGIVGTLIIPWKEIRRVKVLGVGGRIGLKSGLITGFMGGAALCVAAFVRTRLCDYADEESAAKARLWSTWLVALAGLLPSVCVGFIGGSLAALVRQPSLPDTVHQRSSEEQAVPNPAWLKWLGRGVAWVSVFGLLIPLLGMALHSKPPRPTPPAPVAMPAPPPWRYERPEGLAEATPQQFLIVARRGLPDSIPGAPCSISPDGNWLAYSPAKEAVIARVDLNTALVVHEYPTQTIPTAISWSPDSKQLLILSQNPAQRAHLHVAEIDSGAVIPLPRPKDRELPEGPILWSAEKEVVFFPSDEPSLFYDLDQLRLHPLESKDTYRPTATWTAEQKLVFPSTKTWRIEPAESISEIRPPPRRNPSVAAEVLFTNCLALAHPIQPVRCCFSQIPLNAGVTIVPASDCSKIVRVQNGHVEVFYFSLREPQASLFTLTMPAPPQKDGSSDTVAKALEDHSLCAMIYEPMVNPLTGKTIGPDRERPKGLLRFITWTGEIATLWAAESYDQLAPHLVVADVHQWKSGAFTPSPLLPDLFWWAPLGQGDPKMTAPPLANARPLHWSPAYAQRGHLYLTLGEAAQVVSKPPNVRVEPVVSPVVPDTPSIEQRIREFVLAHHDKATAGDIAGLGRDYADQVDYLGKTKTNEAIMEEERQYHLRWSRVTEGIVSPITVTPEGDSFTVRYTLNYRTEKTEGGDEWASGRNDLTLTVRAYGGAFLITRQIARLYDRQSSQKAPANSPAAAKQPARLKPVAITLPKPCWIATERASNDRTLEITDLFHLNGSIYKLHRTYRRLSADGLKVLAYCRAEYEGSLQQSGNVLPVYFGQQRWGQDGDNALVRQVESNAASVIGSTLELTIQPDGSLGRGGLSPMRRVP